MRIVQLVPDLTYGDAVGNDVLALHKIIKDYDPETKVYALVVDVKRIDRSVYEKLDSLPMLSEDDIIFYHMAVGSAEIRQVLLEQHCRKYIVYHNVTPPHFFAGYSEGAVVATSHAFNDLEALRKAVEGCLAPSEFNLNDLRNLGYDVPMAVLPIVVPFDDYAAEPSAEVISRYKDDGFTNILFVGRVAPNKKHEDIIKAFCYYKKHINPKSRLFLVGNSNGQDIYYNRLLRYVESLGVDDVVFSGHIPFRDILAYYRLADVFVCMSEHEGFCVPLLEAMYFDVPILAYDSTAIPYTLRKAGLIFKNKAPEQVAFLIDRIVSRPDLRQDVLACQQERLQFFSYKNVSGMARKLIDDIIQHREFSIGCEKQADAAYGALQSEALLEAAKVSPREKLLSFEQIPITLDQETWHLKIMSKVYKSIYSLNPVLADKIKTRIKKMLRV